MSKAKRNKLITVWGVGFQLGIAVYLLVWFYWIDFNLDNRINILIAVLGTLSLFLINYLNDVRISSNAVKLKNELTIILGEVEKVRKSKEKISQRLVSRIFRNNYQRFVSLSYINFLGIDFREVDLFEVELLGAKLQDVDLQRASLTKVDLRGANLQGANLQGANLQGANLYDTNLQGANLQGANLYDTNLQGANLRGANLRGANLRGANLRGIDLREVYLRDVSLSKADLYQACAWQSNKKYFLHSGVTEEVLDEMIWIDDPKKENEPPI